MRSLAVLFFVTHFAIAGPATSPSLSSVHQSVYDTSLLRDGGIIAAGTLATVVPYVVASSWVVPRCPCSPSEVNAFDRGVIGNASDVADKVSDVTVALCVAGPAFFEFMEMGFSAPFWEDMIVFAQAIAVNGGLVAIVKHAVQRPLPRVYGGQAPELIGNSGGYTSFYSGHVSTAFAALSAAAYTIQLRYGGGAWPWIATGLVGTSVAIERVLAGNHFYTDVIVGAVIGTSIGILIPYLHHRNRGGGSTVTVLPGIGGEGMQVAFISTKLPF